MNDPKDARVILKTIKQKNFELEAAKKARENRGTRARSRGPAQIRKQYASEVRILKIMLTNIRYHSRFFVQVGHETSYASSGNTHFFTKSLSSSDLLKLLRTSVNPVHR
jgi:hypothetical protein